MSEPLFLYPFLGVETTDRAADAEHTEAHAGFPDDGAIAELAESARSSWTIGHVLDEETLVSNSDRINDAATLIAGCTEASRRVFVIGNGGSACDAQRFARLLNPVVRVQPLLDSVVITALANDVGADRIFDRQIETFVHQTDVVVAFSTSGTSNNIVTALARARRQGAYTIVFAGYGGAGLPNNPNVDVCLTVESSSVHRIQEAQGALSSALADRVTHELANVRPIHIKAGE